MPIDVPDNPKVYTTVYETFKGVDYTNDASNVFKRRSPNGLNMLPDIDGRPYKRTGWEVAISKEDFYGAVYPYPICTYTGHNPLGDEEVYSIFSYDGDFTGETGFICHLDESLYASYSDLGTPYFNFEIDDAEEHKFFYTSSNLSNLVDTTGQTTASFDGWYLFKSDGTGVQISSADDLFVDITIERVHYFEIGGNDYMMIFTGLGLFSYSEGELTYLNAYEDTGGSSHSFPPTDNLDPQKAFFFEGGGDVGFYMFCDNKMFVFDGEEINEVSPRIPTTLISTDSNGVGTMYEAVNLLTPKRKVLYTGSGVTTNTDIVIPVGGADAVHSVEIRDASGEFVETSNYTKTITDTVIVSIKLGTLPTIVEGEDNIAITYTPSKYSGVSKTTTHTGESKIPLKRTRVYAQFKNSQGTISTSDNPITVYDATFNKATPTRTNDSVKYDISFNRNVGRVTFSLKDNPVTSEAVTAQKRNSANNAWVSFGNTTKTTPSSYAKKQTVSWNSGLSTLYSSSTPATHTQTTKYTDWVKAKSQQAWSRLKVVTDTKTYRVRLEYKKWANGTGSSDQSARDAFFGCSRAMVFGNGVINQVFMTASTVAKFNTRVWYSAATDPTYFPDTNYIEVGATDKPIMGLLRVGEYLGVVKQGSPSETAVYLAYPTSFENETTYAVKQSVNGIGAVSNGAFNILEDEPLFLSTDGVMGIEPAEIEDRKLRNRSYYVNKKLQEESELENAISFVYDGMYFLGVNDHCYVLDGSQKSSWANTKTNLQYECYYLENVPAQCFARYGGELWFSDYKGNMCRFKNDTDETPYVDAYPSDASILTYWTADIAPTETTVTPLGEDPYTELRYAKTDLTWSEELEEDPDQEVGQYVKYGDVWYTILSVKETYVVVGKGVPIEAVWGTIADDDGAINYFKNLQKKGNVVSLLPASNSGVDVYIVKDEKDAVFVGRTDTDGVGNTLPFDFYPKKKIKKYKRLQIICRNDSYNDSFGVDQITKCFVMGNYSKNKR